MSDEELKEKDPYVRPVAAGTMEYLFGESLMLFGWQKYHGKKYRQNKKYLERLERKLRNYG